MANSRTQIVKRMAELLSDNLKGESPIISNVFENVKTKQVFWDEITDYPTICVFAGSETREYLPGDFKWAFLTVNMRIFVNDEDSKLRLEELFDDIESVIDNNNDLTVNGNNLSVDIRLLSLTDDEGLLSPLGVGEMTYEVRYEI